MEYDDFIKKNIEIGTKVDYYRLTEKIHLNQIAFIGDFIVNLPDSIYKSRVVTFLENDSIKYICFPENDYAFNIIKQFKENGLYNKNAVKIETFDSIIYLNIIDIKDDMIICSHFDELILVYKTNSYYDLILEKYNLKLIDGE